MGSGITLHTHLKSETTLRREDIDTAMNAQGVHSPDLEAHGSKDREGILVNQDRFANGNTEGHDEF